MGVSLSRGCNGGGGITRSGDLRLPPTEHSCTVHCNQAHYGPVSCGRAEAGVKGGQVVVGAGRLKLGGDVGSVLGGETNIEGEVHIDGDGNRDGDGDGKIDVDRDGDIEGDRKIYGDRKKGRDRSKDGKIDGLYRWERYCSKHSIMVRALCFTCL